MKGVPLRAGDGEHIEKVKKQTSKHDIKLITAFRMNKNTYVKPE